jgi:glutaredoxin
MTIEVYSKEGCAICTAAKDKLKKLGLPFDTRDIDAAVEPHEGWREDGSVDVLAMYAMIDNHLPIIRIDGECTDYANAMRRLNTRQPAGAGVAGGAKKA